MSNDSQRLAEVANQAEPSLLAEFIDFIQHNKAWWLVPVVIVTLLLGAFIWLSANGAAPILYSL